MMHKHRAKQRDGLLGLGPGRLALAILTAVLTRVALTGAHTDAEHHFQPHEHIGSMLTPGEDENFCIRVHDTSIGHVEAREIVTVDLISDTYPETDWEGTRWVHFVPEFFSCPDDLLPEHGLEIYFKIYGQVEPFICPANAIGCEQSKYPYDDPGSGHPEYRVSLISLDRDHLAPPHLINHEVGHSLGLCDGGPGAPSWEETVCTPSEIHTQCRNSVMHSYDCPDADWPSAADRAAVQSQVPSANLNWSFQGVPPKAFF